MAERKAKGPFLDLADFTGRMDQGSMNKRMLENMICAGVFDSFDPDRAQVYAASEMLLRHAQSLAAERASGQTSLFGGRRVRGRRCLRCRALSRGISWKN